jgi:hypothetical protein
MVERRRLAVTPANRPERKKPFVYTGYRHRRKIGRRALLRALADEFEFGNAVAKMYVTLLVRTILEQQPQLLRKTDPRYYRTHAQGDAIRCGVRLKEEGDVFVVC